MPRFKEQELKAKAAQDVATASSSADARPQGESSQVDQHAAPTTQSATSAQPVPPLSPEHQDTTAERFAMTPIARGDNGDEDMEDKMSDQKAPSVHCTMETSATDRIPHEARN